MRQSFTRDTLEAPNAPRASLNFALPPSATIMMPSCNGDLGLDLVPGLDAMLSRQRKQVFTPAASARCTSRAQPAPPYAPRSASSIFIPFPTNRQPDRAWRGINGGWSARMHLFEQQPVWSWTRWERGVGLPLFTCTPRPRREVCASIELQVHGSI